MPMVRGKKNPAHVGLPSRLKTARRQCGIKRRPLAEKAGIAPSTVIDIETKQRLPTVATIARLAKALSVSAGWLAYGLSDTMADGTLATTEGMGTRLQTVRIEHGLTKAALARSGDLAPSAYAKIENGGQTGVEVIEALAQALGVSPSWLAFNQGPQVLPSRRRGRPPAQSADPAG